VKQRQHDETQSCETHDPLMQRGRIKYLKSPYHI